MKKLTFLLTLSVFFLIGCSTEEVLTIDSSIENDSYAKGIANAPNQSGMYVIRAEIGTGSLIVDTKTGLSVTLGIDFENFCSDGYYWELIPAQYINTPNSDGRYITLGQGDVDTTVFDGAFDGTIDFCDFILNTPVLAEGISQLIYNDNDLLGITDNNSNAWSIKANGRLLNQDNESKNLSAKFHETWNKDHHWSFSSSVRLH